MAHLVLLTLTNFVLFGSESVISIYNQLSHKLCLIMEKSFSDHSQYINLIKSCIY